MTIETLEEHRAHGGTQGVYAHDATSTGCRMQFAAYLPPEAGHGPVPVLYWLSGLTCTWANFTEKAGAQRLAAEYGVAIVAPDTSPRGVNLPGEDDAYDFGSGAGFYIDATEEPWVRHYRMESYIAKELPALVEASFPVDRRQGGIFGHSMGGHGALTLALKHPDKFRTCSAFAPIAAPSQCPWGEKAFTGYLGAERAAWKAHDASELVRASDWSSEILIDQGTADGFLDEQLKPHLFLAAAREAGVPVTLRYQSGYDHSYYFMASFMADHIAHHARLLA
ncbi:MAG TPA: S-formylglutathione hydrolase [Geminicoccaceae bacterium]